MKQRYNVAASRARNQMWVVYSLNPDTDLQVGDLRRKLIEHARDPHAVNDEITATQSRADSVFQKQVLERSISQRFRVTPQRSVGAYSIDMVVEGGGKRLAVECDGDRYHPIEKIPEDMARQVVLERLGWTFHRMRGSEFFRDPDAAMERLFRRLEEMGIPPELELSSSVDSATTESPRLETSADKVIRRAAELRAKWRTEGQNNAKSLLAESDDLLPDSSPSSEPSVRLVTNDSGDQSHPVPDSPQGSSSSGEHDDGEAMFFEERLVIANAFANNVAHDTSAKEGQELELPNAILEVLRSSLEPLKAKEIRSRLSEAPSCIHAERRDVNSVPYHQVLTDSLVHRSESDGTVLWTVSAGR